MRKILQPFMENRWFFSALLVINFFGALYGFWWYRDQFAATPVYMWPFVPNSPLAVLYFFLVLILFLRQKRFAALEGLAYFGLIKHGMWTVAIISLYQLRGFHYPENIFLWAGHLGMALQAVLFWIYFGLPLRFSQAAAIAAWYFFNDFLDYVVGIHPRVDTAAVSVETVRTLAVGYSIILAAIYLYSAARYPFPTGSVK